MSVTGINPIFIVDCVQSLTANWTTCVDTQPFICTLKRKSEQSANTYNRNFTWRWNICLQDKILLSSPRASSLRHIGQVLSSPERFKWSGSIKTNGSELITSSDAPYIKIVKKQVSPKKYVATHHTCPGILKSVESVAKIRKLNEKHKDIFILDKPCE